MPQPTLHTTTAPLSRTAVPAAGALSGGPSPSTARYVLRPARNHPAPARTPAPQPASQPARAPAPSAARVLPAHLRTPAGSHT
ncbi:hypothetical protein GCM10023329_50720 [Streptomyces sanyensis]|uniref:Uncharacterized protein n=1 Tax=Streptomyces sanyensis TaxID=568869 RepID=A0ABP9BA08_9ACTN